MRAGTLDACAMRGSGLPAFAERGAGQGAGHAWTLDRLDRRDGGGDGAGGPGGCRQWWRSAAGSARALTRVVPRCGQNAAVLDAFCRASGPDLTQRCSASCNSPRSRVGTKDAPVPSDLAGGFTLCHFAALRWLERSFSCDSSSEKPWDSVRSRRGRASRGLESERPVYTSRPLVFFVRGPRSAEASARWATTIPHPLSQRAWVIRTGLAASVGVPGGPCLWSAHARPDLRFARL